MQFLVDRIKSWPLILLPHHAISRLIYRLTRIESGLTPKAVRLFSRIYDVNLAEASQPDPTAYRSFNQFFTRELASDARQIDQLSTGIASPVDGCVSQAGSINAGTIFQAKGRDYQLTDLLGGREHDATPFLNGRFATLYLSPRDYHRIHMPVAGKLKSMHYVPGRLFSVAPHTVRVVPRLFARNERVVALFDTPAGNVAMILVGAINVAAIETVWAGLVTPPAGRQVVHTDYTDTDISLGKGQEMGRFNMGSTVILLFPSSAEWNPTLKEGQSVKLGQRVGEFKTG